MDLLPSPLAFGAGKLGAVWQGNGLAEGVRALGSALDSGVNVIDTADVYARGLSERCVGWIARRRRDEMIVCTKVGQIKTPAAALAASRAANGSRVLRQLGSLGRTSAAGTDVVRCWDAGYVQWAAQRSLRRLRTDFIDILMLHSPPADAVAAGAFGSAVRELLQAGDIRAFGVSCDTPAAAAAALEMADVSWLELPFHQGIAGEWRAVLQQARGRGAQVLARSPFAGGRAPGLFPAGVDSSAELDERVGAACLAYSAFSPGITSVVVGMSSEGHVAQNVRMMANATPQAGWPDAWEGTECRRGSADNAVAEGEDGVR